MTTARDLPAPERELLTRRAGELLEQHGETLAHLDAAHPGTDVSAAVTAVLTAHLHENAEDRTTPRTVTNLIATIRGMLGRNPRLRGGAPDRLSGPRRAAGVGRWTPSTHRRHRASDQPRTTAPPAEPFPENTRHWTGETLRGADDDTLIQLVDAVQRIPRDPDEPPSAARLQRARALLVQLRGTAHQLTGRPVTTEHLRGLHRVRQLVADQLGTPPGDVQEQQLLRTIAAVTGVDPVTQGPVLQAAADRLLTLVADGDTSIPLDAEDLRSAWTTADEQAAAQVDSLTTSREPAEPPITPLVGDRFRAWDLPRVQRQRQLAVVETRTRQALQVFLGRGSPADPTGAAPWQGPAPATGEFTRRLRTTAAGRLAPAAGRQLKNLPPDTAVDVTYFPTADGAVTRIRISDPATGWAVDRDTAIDALRVARLRPRTGALAEADPFTVLATAESAAYAVRPHTITVAPSGMATVLPREQRLLRGWGGAQVRVDSPVQPDGTLPAVRLTRLDADGNPVLDSGGNLVTRAVVVGWSAETTTEWLTEQAVAAGRQDPATVLATAQIAARTTLTHTITVGRGEVASLLPRLQRRVTGWPAGTRVRVDAPIQPDGTLPAIRLTRLNADGNPELDDSGNLVTRAVVVSWSAETTSSWLGNDVLVPGRQDGSAVLTAAENGARTTHTHTVTLGRDEQVAVLPRLPRRVTGWGEGTRVRVDAPVQADGSLPAVRLTRLDTGENPVLDDSGNPVTRAVVANWSAERTSAWLTGRPLPAELRPATGRDPRAVLAAAGESARTTRTDTVAISRAGRASVLPRVQLGLRAWGAGTRVRVDAPIQPDGTLPAVRLTRLDADGNPALDDSGNPVTRALVVGWSAERTTDWLASKALTAGEQDPAAVLAAAEAAARTTRTSTVTVPESEQTSVLPRERHVLTGWGPGTRVRVDAPIQPDGSLPAVRLTRLGADGLPVAGPDGRPSSRALVVNWSAERTADRLGDRPRTTGQRTGPRQDPAAVLAAAELAAGTVRTHVLTVPPNEQATVLPRVQRRLTGWGPGTRVRVDAPVQPDGTLPVVRLTRLDVDGNPALDAGGNPVTRAVLVDGSAERTASWFS